MPEPILPEQRNTVTRLMAWVLAALLPGTLAMQLIFGVGVWLNIGLAVVSAVVVEATALILRGRPLGRALGDLSAVVTGWLIALCLPPLAPWWLPVTAAALAVAFGKHLYGGLGRNPFNPAMVGYCAVLIAFPAEIAAWPAASSTPADFATSLQAVFGTAHLDAVSGATPLDHLRTGLTRGLEMPALAAGPMWGHLGAVGWEWISCGFLLGGLVLALRGIIGWRISLTVLAGLLIPATIAWLVAPAHYATPWIHALSGATLLGAFFIATDPVTAATTKRGQLMYGAGIGLITWIIRAYGGYPDGFAFAVLLMNTAAPLIDRYAGARERRG
ncbi:MAG: RnfABCDGE type electron transport complex subunit D [Chromatiales bacterium]|nr:RnfABCDGE type electron transport complex subunit D [Chromatiales bacterium]